MEAPYGHPASDADCEPNVHPGVYMHYKGGRYTVLFVATESTNTRVARPVVVYVSHGTGRVNVRDQSEFREPVVWSDGQCRPRFTRVL